MPRHRTAASADEHILDALLRFGVLLGRLILAHPERNVDAGLHAELATRGASLGYDTIGRTTYHSDGTVLDWGGS